MARLVLPSPPSQYLVNIIHFVNYILNFCSVSTSNYNVICMAVLAVKIWITNIQPPLSKDQSPLVFIFAKENPTKGTNYIFPHPTSND